MRLPLLHESLLRIAVVLPMMFCFDGTVRAQGQGLSLPQEACLREAISCMKNYVCLDPSIPIGEKIELKLALDNTRAAIAMGRVKCMPVFPGLPEPSFVFEGGVYNGVTIPDYEVPCEDPSFPPNVTVTTKINTNQIIFGKQKILFSCGLLDDWHGWKKYFAGYLAMHEGLRTVQSGKIKCPDRFTSKEDVCALLKAAKKLFRMDVRLLGVAIVFANLDPTLTPAQRATTIKKLQDKIEKSSKNLQGVCQALENK